MRIIRMMTLSGFCNFLTPLIRVSLILGCLALASPVQAQNGFLEKDFTLLELRTQNSEGKAPMESDSLDEEELPDPNSVMYQSMILPGWDRLPTSRYGRFRLFMGYLPGWVTTRWS